MVLELRNEWGERDEVREESRKGEETQGQNLGPDEKTRREHTVGKKGWVQDGNLREVKAGQSRTAVPPRTGLKGAGGNGLPHWKKRVFKPFNSVGDTQKGELMGVQPRGGNHDVFVGTKERVT